MGFIGNFLLFQWLKNFENRLRFDEVSAMSLVASSSLGHGLLYNNYIYIYAIYRYMYTHCESKNCTLFVSSITLSKVDQF